MDGEYNMSDISETEESTEFSESLCYVLDYIEKKCNKNYNSHEELLNNIIKITDVLVNTTLEDEDYDILIRCSNTLKKLFGIVTGINVNLTEKLNENNEIIYMKLLEKYNKNINDTFDNNYDLVSDSSYNTFRAYSNDIKNGDFKFLTFEEEQGLGKRIKEKDKEAMRKLVTSNLWLVFSIARDFKRSDVEFMDLVEIGNEALIRAAWKFDYTRNMKFSTYACIYITGYLHRYRSLFQTGTCLNPYLNIRLTSFLKVYNSLDEGFFEDKLKETAEILNISEEEGRYLLQLSKGNYSLNQKISDEADDEFINTIPDDENVENRVINKLFIDEIFSSDYLTDIEKEVLRLKYGIDIDRDYNIKEISEIMSLTPTIVSETEHRALRKIRVKNKIRILEKNR